MEGGAGQQRESMLRSNSDLMGSGGGMRKYSHRGQLPLSLVRTEFGPRGPVCADPSSQEITQMLKEYRN